MIEYPIEKLVESGVSKICIVTGYEHMGRIVELCQSGSKYGADITYRVQENAGGIAQAIGLCRDFVGDDDVCVLLGDNLFDAELAPAFNIFHRTQKAVVLAKEVHDPERFGVVRYDDQGVPVEVVEKPDVAPSNHAVIGVYIYPKDVFDIIPNLTPSARGELEVTDITQTYLQAGKLSISIIDGFWIDAGTHESLREANIWAYNKDAKYDV